MELRLYSFVVFYLSSIQQGIQTGHAAVDLVRKYSDGGDNDDKLEALRKLVNDWADHHKTFIVLNGGDADGVDAAHDVLMSSGLPYVAFHESHGALRGLKTTVCAVIPASIFDARARNEKDVMSTFNGYPIYDYVDASGFTTSYYPNHSHYEVIKLLRGSRLAS